MSAKRQNLNGNAPDKSPVALLMIDLINPLDFPEAGQLLRYLPAMTRNIRRLKTRAQKAGVPVIYVNDNFGRWRSDLRAQIDFCLAEDSRGCEMVRQLSAREGGLFYSQVEALGLLRHHPGNVASPSRRAPAHPHRDCGKLLRPLHRERRLHARL